MNEENVSLLEKISEFIIKGIIITTPLFFLPWSSAVFGVDSFGKQLFFVICVILLLLASGLSAINKGRFLFRFDWPDFFVLTWLIIMGIATFFSIDKQSALFGNFVDPSLSLAGLAALIFFFLALKASKPRLIGSLYRLLISTYAFIVFLSFVVLTGITPGWVDRFFTLLAGNTRDLSLFIVVFIFLLLGLRDRRKEAGSRMYSAWFMVMRISFFLGLLILAVVDYLPAWWAMLAGMLFVLSVRLYLKNGLSTENEKNKTIKVYRRLAGLVFLLIMPLFFLGLNYAIRDGGALNTNDYTRLRFDNGQSCAVISRAIKDRFIAGYGPEQFPYIYSLYRGQEMNDTPVWNIRFNRPSSYYLEVFLASGISGFFMFIIFIFGLLFILFKTLIKLRKKEVEGRQSELISGLSGALVAILVMYFLVAPNFLLYFIFWTIAGFIVFLWRRQVGSDIFAKTLLIEHKKNTSAFFLFTSILLVVFILVIIVMGILAKQGAARYYYAYANGNVENLAKAADLDPKRHQYRLKRVKLELRNIITALTGKGEDKDMVAIEKSINNVVSEMNKAKEIAPFSIIVRETDGILYRELGVFSPDSNIRAIQAFKSAILLEPKNPVLYSELGDLYILNSEFNEAVIAYREAISLKSGYFRAQLGLAKALALNNNPEEAISIFQQLAEMHNRYEINYEFGRTLFSQARYEEAITQFKNVLKVEPNHANTLYSLGLALEETNKPFEAIDYFKKVLELNPDNLEVKERVKNLENK